MDSLINSKILVVPAYINESIVIDMLATIEDCFSWLTSELY